MSSNVERLAKNEVKDVEGSGCRGIYLKGQKQIQSGDLVSNYKFEHGNSRIGSSGQIFSDAHFGQRRANPVLWPGCAKYEGCFQLAVCVWQQISLYGLVNYQLDLTLNPFCTRQFYNVYPHTGEYKI
jgi:hypothetical protein